MFISIDILTKILYTSLFFSIRDICTAHLTFLYLNSLATLSGEQFTKLSTLQFCPASCYFSFDSRILRTFFSNNLYILFLHTEEPVTRLTILTFYITLNVLFCDFYYKMNKICLIQRNAFISTAGIMVYYLTGPAHARCVYAYVVIYVYVKQLVRNIS